MIYKSQTLVFTQKRKDFNSGKKEKYSSISFSNSKISSSEILLIVAFFVVVKGVAKSAHKTNSFLFTVSKSDFIFCGGSNSIANEIIAINSSTVEYTQANYGKTRETSNGGFWQGKWSETTNVNNIRILLATTLFF